MRDPVPSNVTLARTLSELRQAGMSKSVALGLTRDCDRDRRAWAPLVPRPLSVLSVQNRVRSASRSMYLKHGHDRSDVEAATLRLGPQETR